MQSVQRLWGEKFIKVWYNKSHAAGRFPYNDKNEGMHMANGIIFLVGALIMFYMALRSVRARQLLRTKGVCVQATVSGTVQSRDGAAYVLEFTTAGGSHRLQYPKPAKGKPFAELFQDFFTKMNGRALTTEEVLAVKKLREEASKSE